MRKKKNVYLISLGIIATLIVLSFNNYKIQVSQSKRCNWFDIFCYPHFQEHTAVIAEELWGQAGIIAYQAAAGWMYANNSNSQELDNIQKEYLRPYFGSLVDQVAITYNATLMDGWLYGDFKINIGQVDAIAQTYCLHIYIEDSYRPRDYSQLILLAHELVHARQCQQLGGARQFGYRYFKEYKKAGQNYANNIMEIMADKFEKVFAGWLSQRLAINQVDPEQEIN